MAEEGRRIAFVVNPLKEEKDLKGGDLDIAKVYSILRDKDLGGCDPEKSKLVHKCRSRNDFQDELVDTIGNWKITDQLIFYYTGHGKEINDEFCFEFGKDLLPFNALMADLKINKVNNAILIIDACHAGAAIGIKGDNDILEPIRKLKIPKGIAIITSSRATEESHEIEDGGPSVFTELFCAGISCGLDKSTEDGLICVGDIVEYVNIQLETKEKYKRYPQHCSVNVSGLERRIWISKNKTSKEKKELPIRENKPVRTLEDYQIWYERTVPTKHPCYEAQIEDLDWELVEEFAELVEPGLMQKKTKEQVLEDLKLFSVIRHNGNRLLHKSAVLCFCKQPAKFYPQTRAVFASGNWSDRKFIRKDINGPLSKQFKILNNEVMNHLDKVSIISKDGLRREKDEIDEDVVRELLSNAIIHRNYEMSGTVQVKITPEALEVQNPGSFPINTSWDILIKGKHSSNPGDATIAWYLENVKLRPFEGMGRGFEVFKKYIKENGRDSITCEELPGPAIRIRVRRRTSESIKMIDSVWRLTKSFAVYIVQVLLSIVMFGLFASSLVIAGWLSNRWPEIGLITKIVAWPITILGGISCITFMIKSSIVYTKSLFRKNPQETSGNEVIDERRIE